ncbi:MAG: histidine phosphatase family protein [Oscillospiraceae bacterium]|nr:histidine phosphatase family protein [Oscillospiraceae bacterium]
MIGGVILAAGYSSRMGELKPLLPVGGVPALLRAAEALSGAGAEVAVVTGHRREELTPLIRRCGALELPNPDYDRGMFTSVLTGLRHFAALGAEGVLLLPCDCAAVPKEAVRQLVACAGDRGEYALPVYGGKNGHPLWIPARYFDEILGFDGPGGLKGARLLHEDSLLCLPMPWEGVVLDMDTPEDYAALCRYVQDDGLASLARGRRFLLLRHGATELHSGKVVMGRYDARLSAAGREQMKAMGRRLADMGLAASALYTSPLRRARDSAGLVNEALGLPLREMEAFSEISLGAWDGLLIDEVKSKWPAEYERRGRYLMSYRFDEGSESFYMVQHRVRKGLLELLRADDARDILILSHAGVIKCLWGLLQGRDIDWAFPLCRPDKGELTVLET